MDATEERLARELPAYARRVVDALEAAGFSPTLVQTSL